MSYNIETIPAFDKKFKKLSKKYKSLKSDLRLFVEQLKENPEMGANLGNGIRKVRMAISSKGKGKSHGARVITHTAIINITEGLITLLTLYDKAEQNTITEKEISILMKQLEEH